ncbi:MAG: hypothetical protein M1469_06995 [Bacteroidetes bacterium]|nr:hypothetical protein [Bacteroidota bacterium]
MKKIVLVLLFYSVTFAQSYPGSFARIGLNAKGMSLGNAISAMTTGNVYPFYNPALASFQHDGSVSASVSLMSLNRQLNVITYTQGLAPTAGLALGVINGTVSNIDGRDADGVHTSNLSTSEDLLFFSFSNQFVNAFSLGVSLKMYYYNLYSGMSATTIGFDFGGLYKPTDYLSIAFVATDIGESYHWDSSKLYGTDGSNFSTPFPHIFKVAASYSLPAIHSSVMAEYDIAPSPLNGIRGGVEFSPLDVLVLRAGFAATNEQYVGTKVTPTFGFGAKIAFLDLTPQLDYAYVSEPFSPYGIQTVSLIFEF